MVHGSSSHSFAISELALQKKNSSLLIPSSKHSQRPSTFSWFKNSIEPLKCNSSAPWTKMDAWKTTFDPFSFHLMGVSENSGTPKSSILIGFSIQNHPFWGYHHLRKHPYGFRPYLFREVNCWNCQGSCCGSNQPRLVGWLCLEPPDSPLLAYGRAKSWGVQFIPIRLGGIRLELQAVFSLRVL